MSSVVIRDSEDVRDSGLGVRRKYSSHSPPSHCRDGDSDGPPPPEAPPPCNNHHQMNSGSAFQPLPGAPATIKPQTTRLKSKNKSPSPSRSSTGSESPPLEHGGTDGQGGEEGHGAGEKAFDWPAHSTYDERRQLLGTEEESSERQSSDEEEDKNPWMITREQTNYYTTQFLTMQPNPRGSIPGALAKEFFEKSRLPIAELRKIWQLSDVTKDGCLSLEEFLTAMHLVVLRRNDISLPEELPPTLQPRTLRAKMAAVVAADSRHNKDLYTRGGGGGIHSGGLVAGGEPLLMHDDATDGGNTSEDMQQMRVAEGKLAATDAVGEATVLSPGSVASPGPKPVSFDSRPPDARRNPNIIQPVPLRLSPESPVIPTSDDEDGGTRNGGAIPAPKQGKRDVVYEPLWNQEDAISLTEESLSSMTLKGDNSVSTTAATIGSSKASDRTLRRSDIYTSDDEDIEDDGCSTEIDGLQDLSPSPPSLPKDPSGPTASLPHFPGGRHPHQKSPPPPPPRPGIRSGHARSSSLDLNQFAASTATSAAGKPPPAVPPRNLDPASSSLRAATSERIVEERPLADPEMSVPPPRDSRSLQLRIHQVKERNSVIARTINELHQEVSDTLEERIALEFHLEQLKSFGD